MKKYFLSLYLLLLLLFQIKSKMTEERRNYILNKLTKKISLEDDVAKFLKEKYYSKNLKDTIPYDPRIIKSIMKEYDFPENFNYLEEKNFTAIVKDQQRCGCCWSHAATTALAYRYRNIGIEVDLSPQDALSCYLRDCDAGNFLIDSQMNLVKNGTLTEGCLPFSSGDGISMEECPTKCKDGSEFKRYYSQNAYLTEDYYSEETFYEIVALIMDQLINKGPVVTGIDVYEDFMNWHYDSEKCRDDVYTYDEESEYLGGHAIVIVGYGYLNSKYYWLIQNSWGDEVCDNGFIKVEFGQIGVEGVAFSEPYIHKEIISPKNIPIHLESIDEECTMDVSTTASFEDWENTLDIGFKNTESKRPFNFQCSTVNIIQGEKNVCYFEYYNFYTEKGTYKFDSSKSLGEENTFSLDNSLRQKDFFYYGIDIYEYIFSFDLYVSQEGSKILLLYYNYGGDDRTDILGPIYANEDAEKPLSDCRYIFLGGVDLVYCDIKEEEVDYFYDQLISPMVSLIYCGYKEYVFQYVVKLDTTKYPVFKIKKFILPPGNTLKSGSAFTLIANIEGSLSEYYSELQYFYAFIEIEDDGQNFTSLTECELYKPNRLKIDYTFNCYLLTDGEEISYDNAYLHPYSMPYFIEDPYEIYIKEMMKGEKYPKKIQVYIESLCPDCVNFITKSFKNFIEKVEKPNLADIEFIPFGNAKEVYNETTKKYDFTCQHGENECYGNLIETCSIQIMGRIPSYEVILCIESNIAKNNKDFDKTLADCLSNDEENLNLIKNCITSDMGNYYEHQMAQKTDTNHKYVPWVVVNGEHDVDAENQIIENLIDYVCGDDKTYCYSN